MAVLAVAVVIALIERSGILEPAKSLLGGLANPVQISLYRSWQSLSGLASGFSSIGSLRKVNVELELKNAILEAEISHLVSLEIENKVLREQLGTRGSALKMISSASVIGFGTGGSGGSFLLDKGRGAGVHKDDLVLVKNIYLGKIAEVSPTSSRVQLLTDPSTKIPAQTASGAIGLVTGEFGTEIKLGSVVQDDVLKIGDLVFSFGEGDVPKGLVLGKIKSVKKVSRELFQEATLEMLLEPAKLTTVFIERLP